RVWSPSISQTSGPTAITSTPRPPPSILCQPKNQPQPMNRRQISKEMPPMSAETVKTLYIDGAWVSASNGATRTVYCPADGSEVGVVSEATTQDTERAIAAARRAFESGVWADRPAAERGDLLLEVA